MSGGERVREREGSKSKLRMCVKDVRNWENKVRGRNTERVRGIKKENRYKCN